MQIDEYPVPNECARARQFVLIPAAVLDDRRIKAAEKIFFAEIMALSNNTGYCYATNTYFRTLYGVSVTTLQGWLANLKTCGYIKIDVIRNPDNSVKERRITPYCLDFAPYGDNLGESPEILGEPSPENLLNPPPKNRQENNTVLNNTSKNKRESKREPPGIGRSCPRLLPRAEQRRQPGGVLQLLRGQRLEGRAERYEGLEGGRP